MKQIKHIFVLVTIVTCFFMIEGNQIFYDTGISKETLLERVMAEAQNPEHEPEQLLSLVLTLLRHGGENNQSPLYAQAIFKLFSNITKGVPYINAYTFSNSLREMVYYVPYYIAEGNKNTLSKMPSLGVLDVYDNFKATVNTMLYCKFSTEYESFKRDPEGFLHHISQEISLVNECKMDLAKLRNTMVRFLELSLSKVIWSPEDQMQTWDSVKEIASGLTALFDAGVLEDINDLDDLFWSLIHRYVYFLDIVGSLMPSSLFIQMKHDVATGDLLLFNLPEQDSFMLSKVTIMQRAIERAEIKAYSFEGKEIL